MFALALYIVFHVASGANDSRSFPFKISPVVSDKCQILTNLTSVEAELNAANLLLNERYGPSACTCGGSQTWRRIAYLDMSDQSQQCPSGWSQIEDPVRACAGKSTGCHSAFFSTDQFTYNHVCGRVMAYQKGSPDGFDFWDTSSVKTLESPYMNGVSLTYGAAGSRQHIWSFVAAYLKQAIHIRQNLPVSVLILITTGHIKCHLLLETITSATLETVVQAIKI